MDQNNLNKIIVTGGAGFIGTNFLSILKSRYPNTKLISLDIRNEVYPIAGVDYKLCDVTNKDALIKNLEGASHIFHLAASIGTHESFENPIQIFNTNVNGTINILDYVKNKPDIKLYIAGMPGIWNNPYSISKDSALRMAKAYYENYNIKFRSYRWFSVYGPYQYIARYNKAVPTFIYNALNNKPLPIYGDGNQVADFIYVEDAVNIAIDSLEDTNNWGEIAECASGKGISVNELAHLIIKLCNSHSEIEHIPLRKGEPQGAKVIANIDKLTKLNNRKILTLEEGLTKTIDFYRKNKIND